MSVTESAAQLMSIGHTVVENGMGVANNAAERIKAAEQALAQIMDVIEHSVRAASSVLGSGHPGMGPILGTASAVSTKVQFMMGMIENAQNEILSLDAAITNHGSAIGDVGQQLLQGGR